MGSPPRPGSRLSCGWCRCPPQTTAHISRTPCSGSASPPSRWWGAHCSRDETCDRDLRIVDEDARVLLGHRSAQKASSVITTLTVDGTRVAQVTTQESPVDTEGLKGPPPHLRLSGERRAL